MDDNPDHFLSRKRTWLITWTLLSIMPIIGMAVDLIAPSLPAIAHTLSISDKTSKNLISIYLLGYGIGNFFSGFSSDAFGRRSFLLLGLLGFTLASLLPIFSATPKILLLARLLQGMALGTVAMGARGILSDITAPERLVHMGTLISTMWGIGPIIGPLIGGYLQFYFGWQAGFYFFALLAFIAFVATWLIVPEMHFERHFLSISSIKKTLADILGSKLFIALILLMGLSYSLIIVFSTSGPFLIQNQLLYTPVFFGKLALFMGIIFIISTISSRYLLDRYSVKTLFLVEINAACIISLLFLITSYFFGKSLVLVIASSALMFFATGLIFPVSMGKGISLFRHVAGAAMSTMYLVNLLVVSLVSFLVSFIHIRNTSSLIWIYTLLMLLITALYWLYLHRDIE